MFRGQQSSESMLFKAVIYTAALAHEFTCAVYCAAQVSAGCVAQGIWRFYSSVYKLYT